MLTVLKGVVTSYASGWKQSKFNQFNRFKLSFPGEDVTPVWCTAWGKDNWGFTKDSKTGQYKPIKLYRGMLLEAWGSFDPKLIASEQKFEFILKNPAVPTGSFKVVGEYRQEIAESMRIKNIVACNATTSLLFGKIKHIKCHGSAENQNANNPVAPDSVFIRANPLVTNFSDKGEPAEYYFDKDAKAIIEKYVYTQEDKA